MADSTDSEELTFEQFRSSDYALNPLAQFPEDLLTRKRHFCQICALKHQNAWAAYRNADTADDNDGAEPRESIARIYLPLNDKFSEGSYNQKFDDGTSIWDNIVSLFGGGSGAIGSRIGALATAASGAIDTAINPFMYMVYKRPEYKEYEMAWILIPRNKKESDSVNDIVNWLKYFSSPRKTKDAPTVAINAYNNVSSGINHFVHTNLPQLGDQVQQGADTYIPPLLLEYPHEFRIRFLYAETESSMPTDIFLPRPKTGYIQKLKIDYFDESGSTNFFRDTGKPQVTAISFTFKESEVFTKNDFKKMNVFSGKPDTNGRQSIDTIQLPPLEQQ